MSIKRRRVSKEKREQVIANATNEQGQVICDHCKHEITDDQQVTLQHHVPLSDLKHKSFSYVARALGIDEPTIKVQMQHPHKDRQRWLSQQLNSTTNLSALHEACHHFVDDGLVLDAAAAAWLNLKQENREALQQQANELVAWLETLPPKEEMRARIEPLATALLGGIEGPLRKHLEEGIIMAEFGPPSTTVSGNKIYEAKTARLKQLEEVVGYVDQLVAERGPGTGKVI